MGMLQISGLSIGCTMAVIIIELIGMLLMREWEIESAENTMKLICRLEEETGLKGTPREKVYERYHNHSRFIVHMAICPLVEDLAKVFVSKYAGNYAMIMFILVFAITDCASHIMLFWKEVPHKYLIAIRVMTVMMHLATGVIICNHMYGLALLSHILWNASPYIEDVINSKKNP